MFNINNIHYHHRQLEMTNKEHEIALVHSANLQKMLLFTVKNSIPYQPRFHQPILSAVKAVSRPQHFPLMQSDLPLHFQKAKVNV